MKGEKCNLKRMNKCKENKLWQRTVILLFEPADAKRSTKCVAGSHSKVLLFLQQKTSGTTFNRRVLDVWLEVNGLNSSLFIIRRNLLWQQPGNCGRSLRNCKCSTSAMLPVTWGKKMWGQRKQWFR